MSSKPESTFIAGVHKHLPKDVYAEKTNNPYRGGTPDVYYEGNRNILWVEYKFVVLPKRDTTIIVPELSELQKLWMARTHKNTGRAWVIVGCKEGGVIFPTPTAWETGVSTAKFVNLLGTRKQLAERIAEICQR